MAILDAGWALFLERGVQATAIEAIARRAGVSKVTLYSHYPDKTALFEAAVLREMQRIEAAQDLGADPGGPIAGRLHRFGIGLMEFLASQPATDFYNAIAGELRRHEGLARAFYGLGPGRSHANLTGLLAAAAAAGELALDDPACAAEELFGLWQGFSYFRFALGIDIEAMRADIPRRVTRGVALFLRVYGVTGPG